MADAAGAELESLVASYWFYPPTDTHTQILAHAKHTTVSKAHATGEESAYRLHHDSHTPIGRLQT